MTINCITLAETEHIKVLRFLYVLSSDLATPDFFERLEVAFQTNISKVVGNQLHSIYSPHNNTLRWVERIVVIGDTNNIGLL